MDDDLKKDMERLKTINWSEVLRKFVAERVRQEQEQMRPIDPVRRIKGSQLAREIQERHLSDPEWNSTEELRKWRDHRK
ncbi:MAG: hypothetical protein ACE5OZ_08125 [Candidatus Heimdallarchaeota archaeon]